MRNATGAGLRAMMVYAAMLLVPAMSLAVPYVAYAKAEPVRLDFSARALQEAQQRPRQAIYYQPDPDPEVEVAPPSETRLGVFIAFIGTVWAGVIVGLWVLLGRPPAPEEAPPKPDQKKYRGSNKCAMPARRE